MKYLILYSEEQNAVYILRLLPFASEETEAKRDQHLALVQTA